MTKTESKREFANREGRRSVLELELRFRGGDVESVPYSLMGRKRLYGADAKAYGTDMEFLAIRTMDNILVVKGYHLRDILTQIVHRQKDVIAEATGNVLQARQAGEPVCVGIDILPLPLVDNGEVLDVKRYVQRSSQPGNQNLRRAAPAPQPTVSAANSL